MWESRELIVSFSGDWLSYTAKLASSPSFKEKYEGVSKSFRTELITKYTLTFGITR
jgi:hypothetical protein